ncbi:MAG: protein kinase, partial [Desulfobacterales bacterium]|nr:protein kinase [Desulfobacterales bacterium]
MTDILPIQFGKYLLLEKVAVGGMAELHRARITGTQGFEKLVAIKKLLFHLTDETDLVDAFINEAKLAALLQHQNIVHIFDFGCMEGSYFIAMEYLSGKDLRLIMDKAGEGGSPLALDHALYITSRICEGLEYAHKMKDFQGNPLNIIHRDISPQNILITYDGEVKIVDFGIAKAAGKNTKTKDGVIKGKVAYMSPEQASGKAIDKRSDIFSAGILLYEMLTGRQMFRGDAMEVLALVQEANFEPPEDLGHALPARVLEILHRALARNPEDRYQSCGDMLSDLEEYIYQNALRPTTRSLAQYMQALFHQDIAGEEQFMRDTMRMRILHDSEPETEIQVSRKSVEKTRELSPSEIPGKPGRKIPWFAVLTGMGVVIVGLLFAASFWDIALMPNHKTAAILGKGVPLSQAPKEPASSNTPVIDSAAGRTKEEAVPLPEALVSSQAPKEPASSNMPVIDSAAGGTKEKPVPLPEALGPPKTPSKTAQGPAK